MLLPCQNPEFQLFSNAHNAMLKLQALWCFQRKPWHVSHAPGKSNGKQEAIPPACAAPATVNTAPSGLCQPDTSQRGDPDISQA